MQAIVEVVFGLSYNRHIKGCRKAATDDDDTRQERNIAMIEATSCGGVVIFRGKILVLYKSYRNKYEGWVLPKGTVEEGETFTQTALREVEEETGVKATIIKYIGKSRYTFHVPEDTVNKDVHWYLMMADSYYSKPQREEYFVDSGYYKYHEAYHLLKFSNEKVMLERAYQEYLSLKRKSLWGIRSNFSEGLGLEYADEPAVTAANETRIPDLSGSVQPVPGENA